MLNQYVRGETMAQNDRPNVLFISFDDLNHYVGFLDRAPNAVTPHFNRLAERCTVFERAYGGIDITIHVQYGLRRGTRWHRHQWICQPPISNLS